MQLFFSDYIFQTKLQNITKQLFYQWPPFDLSNVDEVSRSCKIHSAYYVNELQQFSLWALKSK